MQGYVLALVFLHKWDSKKYISGKIIEEKGRVAKIRILTGEEIWCYVKDMVKLWRD